jgi:hypothetical protein
MSRSLIVLLVPVLVSAGLLGCPVGPSVGKYPPAHTPFGAQATLTVGRNTLIAELLDVRDSALVVLHERQIMLVPYNAIRKGTFAGLSVKITAEHPPTAEDRESLRVVSRFPQGMTLGLERRLLAAYGQNSIVVTTQ